MTRRRSALRRDDGASAVEYALLLAAIAGLIVAVVFTVGLLTQSKFSQACTAWDAAAGTTNC